MINIGGRAGPASVSSIMIIPSDVDPTTKINKSADQSAS
jgi:hypothetical protein